MRTLQTIAEFLALGIRCRVNRQRMVAWLDAEADWCRMMARTGLSEPMPSDWLEVHPSMTPELEEVVALELMDAGPKT